MFTIRRYRDRGEKQDLDGTLLTGYYYGDVESTDQVNQTITVPLRINGSFAEERLSVQRKTDGPNKTINQRFVDGIGDNADIVNDFSKCSIRDTSDQDARTFMSTISNGTPLDGTPLRSSDSVPRSEYTSNSCSPETINKTNNHSIRQNMSDSAYKSINKVSNYSAFTKASESWFTESNATKMPKRISKTNTNRNNVGYRSNNYMSRGTRFRNSFGARKRQRKVIAKEWSRHKVESSFCKKYRTKRYRMKRYLYKLRKHKILKSMYCFDDSPSLINLVMIADSIHKK